MPLPPSLPHLPHHHPHPGTPALQTVEATQKGVVELQDAEKYQKSARPIKCMIVLMVLILIMVGVIIARKS
jgi:hypothetical protein